MVYNRMTTDLMVQQQPGPPMEGEYYKETLAAGSELGDIVYDVLNNNYCGYNLGVVPTIAIVLLGIGERKATLTRILEGVRALPYLARMLASGTESEKVAAKLFLGDVRSYLAEEKITFDVNFPPEDYCELRPQSGQTALKANPAAKEKLLSTVGLEMRNEEKDPVDEKPYSYDFMKDMDEWSELFESEYIHRRCRRTRPTEYVFVLPPGQEKTIFEPWYKQRHNVMAPDSHGKDYLRHLPTELKDKILMSLLLFPGKLRVTATVTDNGTHPVKFFDQIPASSYKFGLAFKMPQYMLSPLPNLWMSHWQQGNHTNLGSVPTLLSVLQVNKELRCLGEEIFYGQNYFEVLDNWIDRIDISCRDIVPNESAVAGEPLTHRWLELMSAPRFRNGTRRYDDPPLSMIKQLNIDLCAEAGEPVQSMWHFDRSINAVLSMPCLTKLVIDVYMVNLETCEYGQANFFARPELWPSLRKLPWGRSKPKLYIPENRSAEAWLQELIDAPDNDPTKISVVSDEDWWNDESPTGTVTDAILEASKRHMDALMSL